MTIREYKEYIDSLNADELVEILRLARLTDNEKIAFEQIDIFGRRLKAVYYSLNIDPRQLDKILHKARSKVITRVLKQKLEP